jgi:hypothetical protein
MADGVKVQSLGTMTLGNRVVGQAAGEGPMDIPTAVGRVVSLLERNGVQPDSLPEPELRQKAKMAAGILDARAPIDPEARETLRAWREYDATARLAGADPFAWIVARELSPQAQYETAKRLEEEQRVRDFAGTDLALGRLGAPNGGMAGKYEPMRDNRDEQPNRIRNSEGS